MPPVFHHGHHITFLFGSTSFSSRRFLVVSSEPVLCPVTGKPMVQVGTARRIVREADRFFYVWIPVYKGVSYHRVLPSFLIPYKQYTADVIYAALSDDQDLDLFDLPADSTRSRWKNAFQDPDSLLFQTTSVSLFSFISVRSSRRRRSCH